MTAFEDLERGAIVWASDPLSEKGRPMLVLGTPNSQPTVCSSSRSSSPRQPLDACKVDYVIVSGYVAILTGRSRSTEDIDVILESLSETETEQLVTELKDHGYWGMAMPLDEMYSMLSEGSRIRIAEEGEMYPNFETWFVSNDVEREALSNPLTVTFDEGQIEISPLELQIAYKLRLAQAADSLSGKDFEDALHLYLTFEERFNTEQLETYVKELGVEDYYAELTGV